MLIAHVYPLFINQMKFQTYYSVHPLPVAKGKEGLKAKIFKSKYEAKLKFPEAWNGWGGRDVWIPSLELNSQ